MNRTGIVSAVALGAACYAQCSSAAEAQQSPQKPNIVIFLADDAGYADFSCYDSKYGRTPNIDSLAKQGMRFTDFYAAAPICSPSRAGLLTGRIPARTGIYTFIPEDEPSLWLQTSEITIPKLLKNQGYSTCHVGKWHLSHLWGKFNKRIWGGPQSQPQPQDFGFDYSFGTTNNALPDHCNPHNFIRNKVKIGKTKGYSCQLVADEGIKWLENRQDKSKPFFLYIAYHEPHERVAAPEELVSHYEAYTNKDKQKQDKVRTYYGTIENLDNATGRVLSYLDKAGLKDNTWVIVYSDNGSRKTMSYWAGTNKPLRGYKCNVWDGGIRSPAIMRWPGVIEPGSICTTPVGAVDLLPTICKITGAKVPTDRPIDGTNILPVLKGKEVVRRTPLFWFQIGQQPAVAMRDGDWSLLGYIKRTARRKSKFNAETMADIKSAELEKFELFNIRQDIGQSKEMSKAEPERFEAMKKQMIQLFKDVIAEGPTWKFEEQAKK